MIKRIGFPCTMYTLPLSTNHTFRLAGLSFDKLSATIHKNLDHMKQILDWMEPKGLRLFRIGSSLVPFASHKAMTFDWQSVCREKLGDLGKHFSEKGFRFSLHPGQYNVLNSENPDVVEKTIKELEYSCEVLDLMKLDQSHKVVLHGGCKCGDLANSKNRLISIIKKLPQKIKSRLILENDERIFSLADILEVSQACDVPAVFDIHHYKFLPSPNPEQLLPSLLETWKEKDGRPKLHISSQKPDSRNGKHDDLVHKEDLLSLCRTIPFDFDLMVEAKNKEVATIQVLELAHKISCF